MNILINELFKKITHMWKQNQKQPLYFKAFFKTLIGFVTKKKSQ